MVGDDLISPALGDCQGPERDGVCHRPSGDNGLCCWVEIASSGLSESWSLDGGTEQGWTPPTRQPGSRSEGMEGDSRHWEGVSSTIAFIAFVHGSNVMLLIRFQLMGLEALPKTNCFYAAL